MVPQDLLDYCLGWDTIRLLRLLVSDSCFSFYVHKQFSDWTAITFKRWGLTFIGCDLEKRVDYRHSDTNRAGTRKSAEWSPTRLVPAMKKLGSESFQASLLTKLSRCSQFWRHSDVRLPRGFHWCLGTVRLWLGNCILSCSFFVREHPRYNVLPLTFPLPAVPSQHALCFICFSGFVLFCRSSRSSAACLGSLKKAVERQLVFCQRFR